MRQFDPSAPPRRRLACTIETDDGPITHYVYPVPIGVIDNVLERALAIFDVSEAGNVRLMISDGLKKYPNDVIEIMAVVTGYKEEDIRNWDIDLCLEIALDWVNGNIEFVKKAWSKKKGILGGALKEETKEAETSLKPSGNNSGESLEPRIISSASDIPR
jgi:hypothetical protein